MIGMRPPAAASTITTATIDPPRATIWSRTTSNLLQTSPAATRITAQPLISQSPARHRTSKNPGRDVAKSAIPCQKPEGGLLVLTTPKSARAHRTRRMASVGRRERTAGRVVAKSLALEGRDQSERGVARWEVTERG